MVGNNEIAGEIPTELGNLRRLQFLGLEDNDLEGLLPTELGRLSMLGEYNRSLFVLPNMRSSISGFILTPSFPL